MPTLVPWTNVEIGDVDLFLPVLPSLVVYTWYVDDAPESSVTYFWRDDITGIVHHELLFVGPVTFDEAVTRAQEEAPKRSVEKIHVKHARSSNKIAVSAKRKRVAKRGSAKAKNRSGAKQATTKGGGGRRKQPA